LQRHLVGAKALDQVDAQSAQLVAHGGVDAGIAPGDAVPGLTCQSGHTAHEGAANSQNVYVHVQIIDNTPMDNLQLEIAATAAALVVDEGMDYGPAKKRALKSLGLPPRTPLPDNLAVEAAVREHIALFHADTQPQVLQALRALALQWMERLAAFDPHLGGAVWHGTATGHSDMHLHLFSDDPKAVELWLINQNQDYEARLAVGLQGREVPALSMECRHPDFPAGVPVHLYVNDTLSRRGALLPDDAGRRPRGNLAQVRKLLADTTMTHT